MTRKKHGASGNPRGPGVEKNGRSKQFYATLSHSLLESDATLSLSPNAKALLMACAKIFYAKVNGRVFLSIADAAKMIGVFDDHTAARAIEELVRNCFLVLERDFHFDWKTGDASKSRARTWRATWLPVSDYRNRKSSGATNEWREWRPEPGSIEARRIVRARDQIQRWRRLKNIAEGNFPEVPTIVGSDDVATYGNFPEVKPKNVTIVVKRTYVDCNTHSCTKVVVQRATPSQCVRIRLSIRAHLKSKPACKQFDLARSAGIDPAKLSRFLNDAGGRKSITLDQLTALELAIADQPTSEQSQPAPKKRAART